MKASARADLEYAIVRETRLRYRPCPEIDHWREQVSLHKLRVKAIDDLIGRARAL